MSTDLPSLPGEVPSFPADRLEEGIRLSLAIGERYNRVPLGTSPSFLENRYLHLTSLASYLANVSRCAFVFPKEEPIQETLLRRPENRAQKDFLRYFAYATMTAAECQSVGIPALEILWEAGEYYGVSRIDLVNMALLVWENECRSGETKRSNSAVYNDMIACLLGR